MYIQGIADNVVDQVNSDSTKINRGYKIKSFCPSLSFQKNCVWKFVNCIWTGLIPDWTEANNRQEVVILYVELSRNCIINFSHNTFCSREEDLSYLSDDLSYACTRAILNMLKLYFLENETLNKEILFRIYFYLFSHVE